MTHEQLREKIMKAFGGKVPMRARDRWANFLRGQATEIYLEYEWIKDSRFFRWIYECEDVDFGEGSDGLTVWIINLGRVGHD